jgi:ubiquitin C-terminal hydrolase
MEIDYGLERKLDLLKNESSNINEKEINNSSEQKNELMKKMMINKNNFKSENNNKHNNNNNYFNIFEDKYQTNIKINNNKNNDINKIGKENNDFKKMKNSKGNQNKSKNNKQKNENNRLDTKENIKLLKEEFSKKENNYKLEIKNLKDIIANFKEPIFVGLNNIGATCYMNATLQCLSNTKKLTDYFLHNFKNDDPKKIMSNEYYKVITNLWKRENNKMSYSPYSFKEVLSKENPLFAGIAANDSKDLINFLLERFHQELNIINNNINNNVNDNLLNLDQTNENLMLKSFLDEYTQKFNSIISNLFYGILETKSQCKGCNMIKFNFQVFSFLEFPLEQVNLYFYNKGKRPLILSNGENPDIDLYECFEYNQKIDLMTGENQMFCNICNKLCDSYYSTTTYSYPNYLNRGKGAVYKCKVNFPKQLNVINYATFKQGITVFELYAVICHLGPSSMSGHFVAYCKNSIDHKWYLYNDAFVTLCTKPFQYNDGMPYILFYKALMQDT